MRIAILSGGTGWHVQDLVRGAHELKHEAVPVDFRALSARANAGGDALARFDALVVRTMPAGSLEQVVFRMDLLHEAAARGMPVLNPPRAVEVCVDKYLTTARLARAGIATPPTAVCQKSDDAMTCFADLGGDVVLKPLFGSEGRGMCRITDPETAWRTFRVLEQTGQVIYLQQFVRHPGRDFRAFVIGDRVVASMRRTAVNDWRTNVAQGGTAEPVVLSTSETALALRAAEVVGCPIAGVDLLPGPNGEMFVIEVNAVPGWKALAPTCGVDVAKEVVRFLAEGT
ncbi:Alpha-aminoadipate--LysW ligase LysX [Gemmata sp. SH-PL17]|uniref:ATP-grasp domain-containing protein n=1 Tax=Gemmata sp. SH-PL17 TaxID=1630693 RepID=UPI00078BC3C0|nr:RimK family alpha-L-glutamate ligase [Gemmata sp. SH-PL17]AMV24672.1 Alpha-aminoadipate--LysW ligase LysX [Gemmata sp. SH-PL17]